MVLLLDLPYEALYLILWHLRDSPKTLLLVDRVCRKIHEVADDAFWKKVCAFVYPSLASDEMPSHRAKSVLIDRLRETCRGCDLDRIAELHVVGPIRLCRECARFNADFQLYTDNQAMKDFSLTENDLASMPCVLADIQYFHGMGYTWSLTRMYYAYHLRAASEVKR